MNIVMAELQVEWIKYA